ncbi:hypothetical protein ACVIIW_003662 [Bradyrhizobium sp. USDA 4449]
MSEFGGFCFILSIYKSIRQQMCQKFPLCSAVIRMLGALTIDRRFS